MVCGAIYNNPDEELQSKVEMSDAVKKTLEAGIAVEPVDDAHKELMDTVAAAPGGREDHPVRLRGMVHPSDLQRRR